MVRRVRLKLAWWLVRLPDKLILRYVDNNWRLEAASDNLRQAEMELATYLDREDD